MSNIIKSTNYITLETAKMIAARFQTEQSSAQLASESENKSAPEEHPEVMEAQRMSEQIVQDAEYHAEQLIKEARERCSVLEEQARHDVETWWQERRQEDQQLVEQSRTEGYDEGYQSGYQEAEALVRQQYAEMIHEAQAVLERAQLTKQQIIQDAEPFLLDLSIAIAEKIIDEQLSVSQDWILEYIRKLLGQRREQGAITICVSPAQYHYMMNAREELFVAAGAQTELNIVPDISIADQGCVIRTSFGSIDATIGTQLQEIKTALKQIAVQHEGIDDED